MAYCGASLVVGLGFFLGRPLVFQLHSDGALMLILPLPAWWSSGEKTVCLWLMLMIHWCLHPNNVIIPPICCEVVTGVWRRFGSCPGYKKWSDFRDLSCLVMAWLWVCGCDWSYSALMWSSNGSSINMDAVMDWWWMLPASKVEWYRVVGRGVVICVGLELLQMVWWWPSLLMSYPGDGSIEWWLNVMYELGGF